MMKHSDIDWAFTKAAIWRSHGQYLRPVQSLDSILLEDLLGIDRQKQSVLTNTQRFLANKPANHALLWGARGTGKSSIIKALLNDLAKDGLRVIEIDKDDLLMLPEIVDEIREQPYRFIVYCDDLSFEADDMHYKPLKSVMEGSIEVPPDNILLYATSNRRNLMPEAMSDNLNSGVVEGELHYADAIEEKISLADRFGLRLSFHPATQDEYLAVVHLLFKEALKAGTVSVERLNAEALLFARSKGSRSGRTAKQFFNAFSP